MSLREKLIAARLSANGPMAPMDDEWAAAYPLLTDLLANPIQHNGKYLDPVKLAVSAGNGEWVVSVSDPVLVQTLTARGRTVREALALLEGQLGDPDVSWVEWKGKEPRIKAPEDADPKKQKKGRQRK